MRVRLNKQSPFGCTAFEMQGDVWGCDGPMGSGANFEFSVSRGRPRNPPAVPSKASRGEVSSHVEVRSVAAVAIKKEHNGSNIVLEVEQLIVRR
jgi:hypothetical protein